MKSVGRRKYHTPHRQLTLDSEASRVGGTIPFARYEAVGGGANFLKL